MCFFKPGFEFNLLPHKRQGLLIFAALFVMVRDETQGFDGLPFKLLAFEKDPLFKWIAFNGWETCKKITVIERNVLLEFFDVVGLG